MTNIKLIKYEGDNQTFIWKHPEEDFDFGTQLIVHESQEAIFFTNGEALDLFGPGRHTLTTENLPLLKRIFSKFTQNKQGFHSEVYFINRVEQMAVKWGTDSRVQFLEPKFQFPLSIGASGEMSLRVDNSRKLLLKLVGTEHYLNQTKLTTFLKGILMTKVKTYISTIIKTKEISIFEIDQHLEEFSNDMKTKLYEDFMDYGISLERFNVTNVARPDGEFEYEKFKELYFRQYADIAEATLQQKVDIIKQETEARKKIIESQATAQKRNIEGFTYHEERSFDVAEKVADNDAIAPMTSLGVGLGTMAGVGVALGSKVGSVVGQAMDPKPAPQGAHQPRFCTGCGKVLAPDDQFCDDCGTPVDVQDKCQTCGHTFTKPGKFCPKCGTKRG